VARVADIDKSYAPFARAVDTSQTRRIHKVDQQVIALFTNLATTLRNVSVAVGIFAFMWSALQFGEAGGAPAGNPDSAQEDASPPAATQPTSPAIETPTSAATTYTSRGPECRLWTCVVIAGCMRASGLPRFGSSSTVTNRRFTQ